MWWGMEGFLYFKCILLEVLYEEVHYLDMFTDS